ncbi:phage portal protein [Actinacidiphila sp. ITFR-21]|uniref:phage portal protein n=1 Tax=Actinacidiphila sp. ITFR-21 TaxID=3075199 RepID=UPI00288A560D|nr:phage portal protein [Streptomyces sp. ITFR-21]WNI15565.1 phage portal protein [Streptomyces sp. ITFR-21]
MRNPTSPQLRRAAERRAFGGLDTLRDRRPMTVAGVGGQYTVALSLDAESRGYSHSAVAYRCVAAIADNGSSVPLAVRRPDGSVIAGHPIMQLFNKTPNPQMSARVLKSIVLQQMELAGQSFVWLDRGETGLGEPTEAHVLFDSVQVMVDKPIQDRPTTANVIGFIINRADGARVPVLPEEMLWLRYPHPFDPLGALAPWKAARHAVDMDAYAREWQRSSYKNGAAPSGVVYLGEMDNETLAAARAAWRSGVQGPENAGKNLLISSPPGGKTPASYSRVTLTPEEMDYLESRVANREEVELAFGVPHDYLSGGTTYENRTAAKTTLWSDTIVTKLEIIGSEIDRVLLPSDSEEAEFDLSGVDALQDSQDAKASRARIAVYADIAMIDEARADLGYDPLPNGLGQHTLTPYRAQFAPVSGSAPVGADAAGQAFADLSAVVERLDGLDGDELVRTLQSIEATLARGRQIIDATARPALPRAAERRGPSLADINQAYDALEATGRAAVRALAREQRERVLRDFDRLMKKPERSVQWLGEVRDSAAALAREQTLTLAVPDLDAVPATAVTGLSVASGPDGWEERIGLRDLFDGAYWRKRTAALLAPFVRSAAKRGGTSITASFDLDEPAVSDFLAERVAELAGQVTATTEAVLRARVLEHGVAAGESVPELRARLQSVFADLSDYRATMIARTETVGAYSAAAQQAALDAGAVRKTWLATDDKRTRRTHRAASGHSVPLNKKFQLTQSRWPGDPVAPANQSINCRCCLTFQFEED